MARSKKIHLQCLSGVVKAADDGAIYVEGFANKKVIDRAQEVIESDAWNLEDYKKNPVILYNHGMDAKLGATPIGKCEKIDARDDGLFVKVKMSGIEDPDIKRVRDLVKEGMLRAFSVGFNCKESDVDREGIRRIKKADLFEISIVGVPMNQDSLFTLTGKMITTKSINQIGKKICEKKGAIAASLIHGYMDEKAKDDTEKRDELLQRVVDVSGVDMEQIKSVLAGDLDPIDSVLAAFSEVLEVPVDELKAMDKEVQVEVEVDKEPEEEQEPEEEPEEDYSEEMEFKELARYSEIDFQPPQDVADAAKRGLEMREKYGRGGTEVGVARARDLSNRKNVSSLTVQRMVSFFARHEENKDTPPEDGNGQIAWLLWGGDPGKQWSEKLYEQMQKADEQEQKPEEKAEENPFQDCVSAKIPKLLEEGMEQDQAVAVAISMCKESQGEKCEVTKDQYQQFFDLASQKVAEMTVAKQAGQDGVSPVTAEISAAKSESENNDYGNPHLEAQKQTNVFLGQLIAEVQKMSAKLDQMQGAAMPPEPAPEAAPEPMPATPEEKEKAALDLFNKRLENCIKRLKALGVE